MSAADVELWASLPFMSLDDMRDLARRLDDAGVAGVAVSEHACVPASVRSVYPFAGKVIDVPIETLFPDPLIAAAVIGATTTRLRVMTSVLLVPLRHPILLAREVATASLAGGGRLDLGVGTGWMAEEFDALDVPFEARGRRMDESLDIMRRLWCEPVVAHAGREFTFDAVALNPKPAAPVPILIGGHSPPALRRAVHADGWLGGVVGIDDLRRDLDALRTARAQAGVADRPFVIRTGLKGPITAGVVEQLDDLGVDGVVVNPWQVVTRQESIFAVSPEAFLEGLVNLMTTASGSQLHPAADRDAGAPR